MYDKVKLKLPPSLAVVKKTSSSCSNSPSLTVSTGTRHAQHAGLSNAYSCSTDEGKVHLIIHETFKSGDPSPKVGRDDH